MEKVELFSHWLCSSQGFDSILSEIRCGEMSDAVRTRLRDKSRVHHDKTSKLYEIGRKNLEALAQHLPAPDPLDIGAAQILQGTIASVEFVALLPSDNPPPGDRKIQMSYTIAYKNGVTVSRVQEWLLSKPPSFLRSMVEQETADSHK